MTKGLKGQIERYPYLAAVANLLSTTGHPNSDLFDLHAELVDCLRLTTTLISRYGYSVTLTDTTTKPVAVQLNKLKAKSKTTKAVKEPKASRARGK